MGFRVAMSSFSVLLISALALVIKTLSIELSAKPLHLYTLPSFSQSLSICLVSAFLIYAYLFI